MLPWQKRCENVIDFLEHQFPEVVYRLIFNRLKMSEGKRHWQLIVEQVRADRGDHHGHGVDWLAVSDEDFDALPEKLLDRAKQRVLEYQKEALADLQKKAKELRDAEEELQKRIGLVSQLENFAG